MIAVAFGVDTDTVRRIKAEMGSARVWRGTLAPGTRPGQP